MRTFMPADYFSYSFLMNPLLSSSSTKLESIKSFRLVFVDVRSRRRDVLVTRFMPLMFGYGAAMRCLAE